MAAKHIRGTAASRLSAHNASSSRGLGRQQIFSYPLSKTRVTAARVQPGSPGRPAPTSAWIISDTIESPIINVGRLNAKFATRNTGRYVPTPKELASADVTLIVGALSDGDRAAEIAGAANVALEQGATVVFLYRVRPGQVDESALAQLCPDLKFDGGYGMRSTVEAINAFREYATVYGRSEGGFEGIPEGAEILCRTWIEDPEDLLPTGVLVRRGAGHLYVLPAHTADNDADLIHALVPAVLEHRAGSVDRDPAFLLDLPLPGEKEVRANLDAAREATEAVERELQLLTAHKESLGFLHENALKRAVMTELAFVLEGSDLDVRDVEEQFVEDFEIADREAGTRVALCESKAAGGGVALGHINQVNNHRTERFEASVDDLPGLLVVNAFRNDDSLDRRGLPVLDRQIRHARRMNVLVLRTWDLCHLAARKLAGHSDSRLLAELIRTGGGGWLEVGSVDEEPVLHDGD